MALNTYAAVKRKVNGTMTTIYQHVPVQIDSASYELLGYDKSLSDGDAFMIYIKFRGYALQRNDELTDELNGGNPYRVTNRPEVFSNGHVEIKAFQSWGS